MACVNPDGSLSASAKAMLEALTEPLTAEEAAAKAGQPVFKVRASLREMVEAGLVRQEDERYVRTGEAG